MTMAVVLIHSIQSCSVTTGHGTMKSKSKKIADQARRKEEAYPL